MKHDALLESLHVLERTLALGDVMEAERAMQQALERFAATPGAGDDERLRPVYERAQTLALELKETLSRALKGSATSNRASQAYEREARSLP